MLVDAATRDDAAVFQLAPDRALVLTADFFTPIVDDPYAFGAVAAANAFSDLYAMGARPLLALNLVAWPRAPELLALLPDTLRGGADVARRAGAMILGGHSIDDAEPKYGLVAIGEVHPKKVTTLAGAKPGDRLVLTKPLGTGILSTALKRDLITEEDMREAVESMIALNDAAMDAMLSLGSDTHACTDVSGFGLLGHLHNLLSAGGIAARIDVGAVPTFTGVHDLVARGAVPGGTDRNREAADRFATWPATIDIADATLLVDAQTSGGLLIAVAPNRADELANELVRRGARGWIIGTVMDGVAGGVEVV